MVDFIDYQADYYKRRENSRTFQAEIDAIINALQPLSQDRILELGCGSGVVLDSLEKMGCTYLVGLDWLITSVRLAAEKSQSVMLVRGDATHLPFEDSFFDKIYAQHLIEHFADTVTVLSEWRRILKPGGRMVIATPNRYFPHQDWFDDPTHHHIFTMEELSQYAVEAGFVIEDCRITNPYFLHWRLMGFVAEHLQGLHRVPILGKRGMGIMLTALKPS